jgi:hypothetical protein
MANAAGGSCKSGALAGGFSAAAGPVIAGLTEGNFGAGLAGRMAAGCVGSYIGKGSCEAGAVTAAFDYLYNACKGGECWWQGGVGAVQAIGGGASLFAGASVCAASGIGCAVGIPMGIVGGSEAVQGADKVMSALQGIKSEGFNPVKEAFLSTGSRFAAVGYDLVSYASYGGALFARLPIYVEGAVLRTSPMFTNQMTTVWDSSRKFFGFVDGPIGQAINRTSLSVGTVSKAHALGVSTNDVRSRQ